jgi:hypothetical protein
LTLTQQARFLVEKFLKEKKMESKQWTLDVRIGTRWGRAGYVCAAFFKRSNFL